METLRFDLNGPGRPLKVLNATNGGPWHKRHEGDQKRSNLDAYCAARFSYSRNHDSAAHSIYGGPYSYDISCIFPDFDADPDDPASYDFACTDESILICLEAGTQTFFRLGQTIEHQIRKHATLPPRDVHKWALICEHIIRHYNEGWADGFNLGIRYWEIWNEPDLDPEDAPSKRTWGGTFAQFLDLYETAAKHLKACFPELMIGGPSLAHNMDWAEAFLAAMRERGVPIDFFSWHIYCSEPASMVRKARRIRRMLDDHGYTRTQSILDEWNYIKDWTDEFTYSLTVIHGAKGAAFTAACMCAAQNTPIDMLMYYATIPHVFNGVFDYYTYEPLHGYYPFLWFGELSASGLEFPAAEQPEGVYSLCCADGCGRVTAMIACYTDNDDAPERELYIDFGKKGIYEVYLTDRVHRGELTAVTDTLTLHVPAQSVILIKERE